MGGRLEEAHVAAETVLENMTPAGHRFLAAAFLLVVFGGSMDGAEEILGRALAIAEVTP